MHLRTRACAKTNRPTFWYLLQVTSTKSLCPRTWASAAVRYASLSVWLEIRYPTLSLFGCVVPVSLFFFSFFFLFLFLLLFFSFLFPSSSAHYEGLRYLRHCASGKTKENYWSETLRVGMWGEKSGRKIELGPQSLIITESDCAGNFLSTLALGNVSTCTCALAVSYCARVLRAGC